MSDCLCEWLRVCWVVNVLGCVCVVVCVFGRLFVCVIVCAFVCSCEWLVGWLSVRLVVCEFDVRLWVCACWCACFA